MTTSYETTPQDIRRILHPRSMAVIGASDDETKWGGRFMSYLHRHRPLGEVYPINPKATSIFGWPAYNSVAQCPGPVDMAVLLLPRERSAAALAECAQKGVHSIVAITAGYAEAGEEGRIAQEELVANARAAGVRIIGPNCMGLLNTHHNLVATTAMLMGVVDALPKGPIGIVSQSGALMGVMLARGVDIGAGFSSTISVGNQADLNINDFFEYLIEDPLTEVICLYIEEASEPQRFMRLLDKAWAAGKPVLVLKAGRTSAGAEAVSSHTASLAGPYAVFEAVCRARGAYLFTTPLDMIQAALLLSRKVRMADGAIAVLSGSGGGNALLVDQLEDSGLSLAQLTPATRDALVPYLGESNATLPVDLASLSAHATQGSPMEEVLDRVMADANVSAGLMLMTTQPNMGFVAKSVQAAGSRTSKPLLFVQVASNVGQPARDVMKDASYGCTESPHEAIAILKAFNDQRRYPPSPALAASGSPSPSLTPGYQNEVAARRLLEAHGIETSVWRVAMDMEECKAFAHAIGYPVVLKGVSSVVVHKSDHGLVKVRIRDDADLVRAFDAIHSALERTGAPFEGVLVTEMVDVDFELIVGIKVDPGFGPMLLVGSGGVLVEIVRDARLAQAPVSLGQAHALVRDLKCLPLLQGYRGRAAADLEVLCQTLVKLSELAWIYRDQLTELDINPLALSNGRLIALDARAYTHTT